jgi:hypothetical protein
MRRIIYNWSLLFVNYISDLIFSLFIVSRREAEEKWFSPQLVYMSYDSPRASNIYLLLTISRT